MTSIKVINYELIYSLKRVKGCDIQFAEYYHTIYITIASISNIFTFVVHWLAFMNKRTAFVVANNTDCESLLSN